MKETYFSIDIETNGLAPGIHSMISLGAVAFDLETGKQHASFYRNLEPIEDLRVCPETMEWWKKYPEAYVEATKQAEPPSNVMSSFYSWVIAILTTEDSNSVAAYWKPNFDGSFINYYSQRFLGKMIFGRAGSGIDIKTITSLALGQKYSETQIAKVPREWTSTGKEHNHNALDDAREQAMVCYHAHKLLKEKLGGLLDREPKDNCKVGR